MAPSAPGHDALGVTSTKSQWDTVEAFIKEPAFIRNSRLKFHLLSPQNKSPKEAETLIGSCIKGVILCCLKINEYKFS